MRYILALLAALVASPLSAQITVNGLPLTDGLTMTDVNAAITTAAPGPCSTPSMDTLNGTAGSGAPCTRRSDEARPTNVQAANTVLDAACNWAVTFGKTTVSATPIVHANAVLAAATQPIPCVVTARSASAAAGKCFPAQTTTLNLSIITAGIGLAPFSSVCAAGTAVMVVVRDPTQ